MPGEANEGEGDREDGLQVFTRGALVLAAVLFLLNTWEVLLAIGVSIVTLTAPARPSYIIGVLVGGGFGALLLAGVLKLLFLGVHRVASGIAGKARELLGS